jgi:hypothetical protein
MTADPYLEKATQWFCLIGQGEALVLVLISLESSEISKCKVHLQEIFQNGTWLFQQKE